MSNKKKNIFMDKSIKQVKVKVLDYITKPGVKNDSGKLRMDLLPVRPFLEVIFVFTMGAVKYADRNWEKGLQWSRVFGAMMRHGWNFWLGEKYDRECLNTDCRKYLPKEATFDRFMACPHCGTGGKRQHHLASVAWNALALMEFEETHPELDDRPKARLE